MEKIQCRCSVKGRYGEVRRCKLSGLPNVELSDGKQIFLCHMHNRKHIVEAFDNFEQRYLNKISIRMTTRYVYAGSRSGEKARPQAFATKLFDRRQELITTINEINQALDRSNWECALK